MFSKTHIVLIAGFLLLNACRKESSIAQNNQKPTDSQLPDSVNHYPANYLKVGNYWIYKTQRQYDSTWTLDSVYIDHFKITASGDTFYYHVGLPNYVSGGNSLYKEYVRLDADGILRNEAGNVVFSYANLPDARDTVHRGGGCTCGWGGYAWADSVVQVSVGGHQYPAGIYQNQNYCEYGPGYGPVTSTI